MTRYLQLHYLLVGGGALFGLLLGMFVIDIQPAILGWLFGTGAGITGGAFLAAMATGEQLASGPAPKRAAAKRNRALSEWYDDEGSNSNHSSNGNGPSRR